jgi:hypothetical protein
MTIQGVSQLTALAFVAAIDDPPAFADPEISAPISAWSPAINRANLSLAEASIWRISDKDTLTGLSFDILVPRPAACRI